VTDDGRRIVIAGIFGSPHRKGMTAELVESALEGARAEGAEARRLYLADEKLMACLACGGNCFATRACLHDGEATGRAAGLQAADGIVVGAPVYCWQLNGLTALFIDKMRWDTGSVLKPRNRRAAFGIACAGGSGTGCVIALQALYRYFANWAFHGVEPLPVTRFNFDRALAKAKETGGHLVRIVRARPEPFESLGHAIAHYDCLPFMGFGPIDELHLIVEQLRDGLEPRGDGAEDIRVFLSRARAAEEAFASGDRREAAVRLGAAYEIGARAWNAPRGKR
jgi:NAD(P)H-dependent FMN reductase